MGNDVLIPGPALTVFTGLLVAVWGIVLMLFKLLQAAQERQLTEMRADRDFWRDEYDETIKTLVTTTAEHARTLTTILDIVKQLAERRPRGA